MIRTKTVDLTTIPAGAYRKKLKSGGSGIVIMRRDNSQVGTASISKNTGMAIPANNVSLDMFPEEAFNEAIELTSGLTYKNNGPVVINEKESEAIESNEEDAEAEVVIDTDEYKKIVDAYTDKNGKLSYELLNKDCIKAGYSDKKIQAMIEEDASEEEIRLVIARGRFAEITGNHNIEESKVKKMIELLDEVYPKGIFRELNEEIRKWRRK